MLMLQALAELVDRWTYFFYVLHLFLVSYNGRGGGKCPRQEKKLYVVVRLITKVQT
jgi:hypothetical protein